jgi:hypothetical protein
LDGPLPKLCLAVTLSHQDDRHSAVALLLKAALIQVSHYRLLGASGLYNIQCTSTNFQIFSNSIDYKTDRFFGKALHCIICHSLIYGFWLPLLCLQTVLYVHRHDIQKCSWKITELTLKNNHSLTHFMSKYQQLLHG